MAEQKQFISKIKYSNIDYFIKASKIANSLTIQLNGDETKVTFDGSAAKTINITANSIGAAPASLSGTVTDLTNSLTLVKNIVDTTNNRIVLKRATGTKVDYIDGNNGLDDTNPSCTYTLPGKSGQLAVMDDIPDIPTSLPASDVYAWAKASSKPTYNFSEINSRGEAYLDWGGRNIVGSITPIDAAISNLHSANRFAFAKPAGITIEYSTDGGSTWVDYGASDNAKVSLVSCDGPYFFIGKKTTGITINDKLRITLNATNMGVYTILRKLLFNINTNGATGSNVIIERAFKGSETTFRDLGTYTISGWTGWNSIPIDYLFGGGDTQTGNLAILRLTFGITGVSSAYSSALSVLNIVAIGETYWDYPSTMAKTGHLYSYDSSQNATFPAGLTASTLTGKLVVQENAFNVNFRPGLTIYTTGFYYGTSGNEALTLTTKNTVTAIQFMNGQDPSLLTSSSWSSLKPALQIKYNKVAINKVLGADQSPSYELDVNGSIGATTIYENGTSLADKYAAKTHTHSDYITSEYLGQNYYSKTQVDDGFATATHNHDSKYATKSHTHTAAASTSTATTINTYSMNYSNGVLTITSGTTNVASTSHTHDVSELKGDDNNYAATNDDI